MSFIQHRFICRPSDITVSKDAGIEPRDVATLALVVRSSDHCAIYIIHNTRQDRIMSLSRAIVCQVAFTPAQYLPQKALFLVCL
jgi:hypothetical protein